MIFGKLYLNVLFLLWSNLSNRCWIVYSLFYNFDNEWWKNCNQSYFTQPVEKRLSSRATVKDINDVKNSRTVRESVAQNWFRYFKESDTSLEDISKSGRSSIVKDETLLEMIEQPGTNIYSRQNSEVTSISWALWTDTGILEIRNSLKYCKTFDSS